MRKALHFTFFSLALTLLSNYLIAQQDRFAFVVTDLTEKGSGWNALRKLDLTSGEYSQVLLNGTTASQTIYDAATRKAFMAQPDAKYGTALQPAFATGVAAMAYDKRNNRLYYTPMFIDQLRYIDLRTMKVYYVTDQSFTRLGSMHNDEGKIVTRMVIAPDGYGYAVTNDAQTFIRFSTTKNLTIEHLGSLIDAPSNSMSINSRCSSWGGDMIADDAGNLYIFSARNVVYKVDIETRIATVVKSISGLASGFTINGAVVNENNKVLVSSAVDGKAWYVIDPKDWSATVYQAAPNVYRSSDLANSNYLATRANTSPQTVSRRIASEISDKISLYPNPVTTDQFSIQFGNIPTGTYHIELTDIMGRIVMKNVVNVSTEGQVETISLKQISAKGVYLVNLIDESSKSVFNQKLVVQ